MTYSVAVAGASGYAGGEMLRLLASHPDFIIGALTAHSNAGSLLGLHQPHLRSLAGRELLPTTVDNLAGHDVVVLALPHGASGEIAAQLPPETIVVDLGADHRLVSSQDWLDYYGSEHSGTWPYGLPELITGPGVQQREQLVGTKRIAVPGCNVTAITLGLQPGVAAGILDTTDIVAVLAVGYSGAGKAAKTHLLASEALGNLVPYAVGGSHRHNPEIAQNLKVAGAGEVKISFTPVLVPTSRGILATVTARLAPEVNELSDDDLHALWSAAYVDEPFVEVLPPGQWPAAAWTVGANTALIQVTFDRRAGRVVVVTAIDNLVKGTAGGAMQSLNIALGLPETAGLTTQGVAP